jgi:hypothetical protein
MAAAKTKKNISRPSDDTVRFRIGDYEVLLDPDDLARVSQLKWIVQLMPKLNFRAWVGGSDGVLRRTTLQRFICRPPPEAIVSKRHGFSELDYRKCALVVSTSMSERQALSAKRKGKCTSRYRGVSKAKKSGLWRASIRPQGRSYYLGEYTTEHAAALAYNEAAIKYFGPNAFLNDVSAISAPKTKSTR